MKISRKQCRMRRKPRIRKKIFGTKTRPRLVVVRSNTHLYAQLINDEEGVTLTSSSSLTLSKAGEAVKPNRDGADKVGKDIAAKAKELKIEEVVFDRNGYIYHGKVKALADGAREGGLKF